MEWSGVWSGEWSGVREEGWERKEERQRDGMEGMRWRDE